MRMKGNPLVCAEKRQDGLPFKEWDLECLAGDESVAGFGSSNRSWKRLGVLIFLKIKLILGIN